MRSEPPRPGSLRRRLTLTLIVGAAVLALLFFLVVRTYAQQVAQQSQDRILEASLTSLLDAAVVRDGQIELDVPYAAFAMLDTGADDRVFYAIQGCRSAARYSDPQLACQPAPRSTDRECCANP
jgi:two-component system sensor histidine kinase TctE